MENVFVIAEAGVNHNGDQAIAFNLIDAASDAGADAIKFQTYITDSLVTKTADKAEYQKDTTDPEETQHEMLKRLELNEQVFLELHQRCNEIGIEFMSTPFDSGSLDFLVNTVGVNRLKIASGDLNNGPFLLEFARTGKDVILSTGMGSFAEIESALSVLAYGYLHHISYPNDEIDLRKTYATEEGRAVLREKVKLLHCTTEYPTPIDEVNLNAMSTMSNMYGVPVGYSDHTMGEFVSIAAVARGACIIEKHLTLDRTMEGPDHRASLEPLEMKELVSHVRQVERALGNSIKAPTQSEIRNMVIARKSLVATEHIRRGDIFTNKNLSAKRPGSGMSPMSFWSLVGKRSSREYLVGDLLDE